MKLKKQYYKVKKDPKVYADRFEILLSWTLPRKQSKLHKKWAERTKKEKLEGGCG
jgi:hypothetical protein